MSDNFEMLVDTEVSLAESPQLAGLLVTALRDQGLITGDLSSDCVLGRMGYHVGPAARELYQRSPSEGEFWTALISGVEPSIKRSCNLWALGPSFQYIVCPKCNTKYDDLNGEVGESIFAAVGNWDEQDGDTRAICSSCESAIEISEWHSEPPLGFGNLAFTFWNWPPLDSSDWKINIPQLFRKITGHKIVESCGHL